MDAGRRVGRVRGQAFHRFQRPVRVRDQSWKRAASRVRECWPEAGAHKMPAVSPAKALAPKADQRPSTGMRARRGFVVVSMRNELGKVNSQPEIVAKDAVAGKNCYPIAARSGGQRAARSDAQQGVERAVAKSARARQHQR